VAMKDICDSDRSSAVEGEGNIAGTIAEGKR
jgi:hypothetical protein